MHSTNTSLHKRTNEELDEDRDERLISKRSRSFINPTTDSDVANKSQSKLPIESESSSNDDDDDDTKEVNEQSEAIAIETDVSESNRSIGVAIQSSFDTSKKNKIQNPKKRSKTADAAASIDQKTNKPTLFVSDEEIQRMEIDHQKRTNAAYDKNKPIRIEVRKSNKAAPTPLEAELLALQPIQEQVNVQPEETAKSRQRYNQIALQLRIPSLWETDGPLSKHRCFWPRYNAIDNDVSLVRFDFFIDYLYNMFLIDHNGTTYERKSLLCNYDTNVSEQKTLQEIEKSNEGNEYDISRETVACVSIAYRFDEKRFRPTSDKDQQIRVEVAAPMKNIGDIMRRQMRTQSQPTKKRKSSADTATVSQDSDDDVDDDEVVEKVTSEKTNCEGLSLEQVSRLIEIPVTVYEHLFMTQYEIEFPHSMTALQQRLFIGRLNRLEMIYTQEQVKTLPACVAATRAFGLGSFTRPTGWSAKYIIALGKTMHEYVMALFSRIREKSLGEFVAIYGEIHAKSLHTFYQSKLRKLNHQIEQFVRLLCTNCTVFQQGAEPSIPEHPSILSQAILGPHFSDEEVFSKTNSYQKVLMQHHFNCQQERLRKFNGVAYQEVITDDGHRTNSFKVYCDIDELCNKAPNLVTQGAQWLTTTEKPSIPAWCANYMKVTDTEYFFPWLKREQWVWSFRNGIYDGFQDRFWKYGDAEIRQNPLSPYNRKEASAKYIDKDFDLSLMDDAKREDPSLIKVEPVDIICDSQNFSEEVRSLLWALIGRLYFPIRMRDNWQVVLWFKGVAGTGKSTLVHAIRSVYDAGDVGIMSNNIEPQFGLMGFRHSFLLVAPEVKSSFSLDSAMFQTMASGDEISIARKNLEAVSMSGWTVQSVYSSNVYPRWVDSSGSIQRRIIPFIFSVAVKNQKTGLDDMFKDRIDAFIVRSCRTYQKKLDIVQNTNIWDHVAEEFKIARKDVGRQTTELVRFLDEYLVLSEEETEELKMQDKVDVLELERLYQNRRQTGTERNFRFVDQLETDIGSFYALRLSREPYSKRQVICKCRLNLQRIREVRGDPNWKPQMSSAYTQEELIAIETKKNAKVLCP